MPSVAKNQYSARNLLETANPTKKTTIYSIVFLDFSPYWHQKRENSEIALFKGILQAPSKQAVEYLTLRKSSNSKSKPKSTTDGRKKFTKDNQKCLFYSKKNIQGEQFDWFPKQSGILHNSLNSN
jgi:hypothetical protein